MIFEGTVSSVRGNQVKLALSNGQQIFGQGWQESFHLNRDSLCFLQVKINDGGTIEIKAIYS